MGPSSGGPLDAFLWSFRVSLRFPSAPRGWVTCQGGCGSWWETMPATMTT